MDDITSGLSERDMADLCALADGTLPAERRAEVEARVAASPELRVIVERQRRSLAATQMLADEPVPLWLSQTVAEQARPRARVKRSRRRLALSLSAAGALAAVVAAILILNLSGGPTGPSVADAAQLAVKPPSGPAPAVVAGGRELEAVVQGLPFPNFARPFGWHAVGVRYGRVGSRPATVVYYAKAGHEVAYVIVGGAALRPSAGGQQTTLAGVRFQTLPLQGRLAVTWQRGGHTCVMIGSATRAELLKLASWRWKGSQSYQ
jgi:anti-sigma factor RsiW